MRTVLVFPASERAEAVASLDRLLPQQRAPWTLGGNRYFDIDDEQFGYLFADWEPEHGGVAMDEHSAHPWTLQEIESGTVIDGLRFFGFRTYHELQGP